MVKMFFSKEWVTERGSASWQRLKTTVLQRAGQSTKVVDLMEFFFQSNFFVYAAISFLLQQRDPNILMQVIILWKYLEFHFLRDLFLN